MSRWDSRTVPASARRAGRAVVMVSFACAVMTIPAFPAVTAASIASRVRKNTGCDDCSARAAAGKDSATPVIASSQLLPVTTESLEETAGRQAGHESAGTDPGGKYRRPFGISGISVVHGGQPGAGLQPGRRTRLPVWTGRTAAGTVPVRAGVRSGR